MACLKELPPANSFYVIYLKSTKAGKANFAGAHCVDVNLIGTKIWSTKKNCQH